MKLAFNSWPLVLVLVCLSVSVLANITPNSAPPAKPGSPVQCLKHTKHIRNALTNSLASIATSGAAVELSPAQASNRIPAVNSDDNSTDYATITRSWLGYAAAGSPHRLYYAADSSSGCAAEQQDDLTPPHKALWPVSARDVATLLLTCITLFIAAGGGIGGGAVFVVLYVFVGGFTAPQAVALSNITILGGSLANFLANSSRRHPVLDRPLIDWDLIMVMEPTTMLGALLGGYLNKLFPGWLTSCLLTALLSLLTYKLLKRGASTYHSESRQKRLQQLLQQQEHQEEKERQQHQGRVVRLPVAADGLQEPLLIASDSQEEDIGVISHGGAVQSAPLVKVTESNIDHAGAWFDAQEPVDQQQQRQGSATEEHTSQVQAGEWDALVVQVPAHLRRLNVMTQQQQQQQQHTPRSLQQQLLPVSGCHALNVVTPRSQQQQQQRWHLSRSSPAPIALGTSTDATPCTSSATFGASSCSQAVSLLPQYQHYSTHWATAAVPQTDNNSSSSSSVCCLSSCCCCFDPKQLQLSTVQAYERQQLPWQPLVTLFFLSAWVVISDTSKVVMVCGSLPYWLVVLSIVPPALFVMLTVRQWLLAKTAVKEAAAEAATAQDSQHTTSAAAAAAAASGATAMQFGSIHWTPRNSLLYPLMCSAAGVVAGLFGVGGGIVKGPLMLELGVSPEVSAATSATMIMFTAGSAAVVYVNFGGVVSDYAVALLAIGFMVTLLGQLFTMSLVKALGRRSVIIFMMGTLMILATVAASYQSVVVVEAALHSPRGMWTWGSVCKHH